MTSISACSAHTSSLASVLQPAPAKAASVESKTEEVQSVDLAQPADPARPGTPGFQPYDPVSELQAAMRDLFDVIQRLHTGEASTGDLFAAIQRATSAAQRPRGNDPLAISPEAEPLPTVPAPTEPVAEIPLSPETPLESETPQAPAPALASNQPSAPTPAPAPAPADSPTYTRLAKSQTTPELLGFRIPSAAALRADLLSGLLLNAEA